MRVFFSLEIFLFDIAVLILQVKLTQKQWFTCFTMYSLQSYLNVLSNQWIEMFQYLKYIEPRGCLSIPMFHPCSLFCNKIMYYCTLHKSCKATNRGIHISSAQCQQHRDCTLMAGTSKTKVKARNTSEK